MAARRKQTKKNSTSKKKRARKKVAEKSGAFRASVGYEAERIWDAEHIIEREGG